MGSINGQTELQSTTGDAVQTVCGGFASGPSIINTLQQDLFDRCREMVQTATINGTGSSLNLSDADLNAAIQQVVSEETSTVSSMATETSSGQLSNLAGRLSAIRGGSQGGFSLGNFSTDLNHGDYVHTQEDMNDSQQRGGSAGVEWGKLGVFINGTGSTGDKKGTDGEDGFDFNTIGFTAGADYRISDSLVLGGAFGYSSADSDFDNKATVTGGSVETDGYNVSAYGTYYLSNFYVDGIFTYGWNESDINRRILITPGIGGGAGIGADRTATAVTDSDFYSVSVGAGYQFNKGELSYGPYIRISHLDMDIDGYEETGALGLNLAVDAQDIQSLTSVLGGRVSYAMSKSFGVLIPQIEAEWVHEYQDDSRVVNARYVNDPRNNTLAAKTDSPDRNYFNFGLGISAIFADGKQAFIFYQALLGHEVVDEHVLTLGLRFEL